jgi:Flp pilus assembly protein CpaB
MGVHIPASSSPAPASPVPNGTTFGGVHRPSLLRGRAFRPAHRLDSRVLLGLGAAALSLALLAFGLRLVLPESQSLLEATRDLGPGAVVHADDVTAVDVRVPAKVAEASFAADATDQVVGKRLGTRVSAGQLLAASQLETSHTTVAPGRVQVTIPVDVYTASAGVIGPGDTVVVYSTPRQAPTDGSLPSASVVLSRAHVVSVGRGQQGLSVSSGGGPIASLGSTSQPTWLTLDLSVKEGAALVAASRLGSLDVALKAPDDEKAAQ